MSDEKPKRNDVAQPMTTVVIKKYPRAGGPFAGPLVAQVMCRKATASYVAMAEDWKPLAWLVTKDEVFQLGITQFLEHKGQLDKQLKRLIRQHDVVGYVVQAPMMVQKQHAVFCWAALPNGQTAGFAIMEVDRRGARPVVQGLDADAMDHGMWNLFMCETCKGSLFVETGLLGDGGRPIMKGCPDCAQ